MEFLTVRVQISGTSNGANVDYGARAADIELPADYDEEKIFDALLNKARHAEESEAKN